MVSLYILSMGLLLYFLFQYFIRALSSGYTLNVISAISSWKYFVRNDKINRYIHIYSIVVLLCALEMSCSPPIYGYTGLIYKRIVLSIYFKFAKINWSTRKNIWLKYGMSPTDIAGATFVVPCLTLQSLRRFQLRVVDLQLQWAPGL